MLSIQAQYSRLFRPWDVKANNELDKNSNQTDISEIKNQVTNDKTPKQKRKLNDEAKRENRLRKIRGHYRRVDSIQQDATVSTTTADEGEANGAKESPVENLTLCCNRLLKSPNKNEAIVKSEKRKLDIPKSPDAMPRYSERKFNSTNMSPHALSQSPSMYHAISPGYIPEYHPAAEIAQALGVPPTDPLLLESLAHGYAMEMEYARILQQENEAKLMNARKQRPKKYKCPHCQVGFSNNGQLKGHIRIHTGERPYKCDEKNCGKTFTRNEELTRHKRIHSGVRPYPCSTCGKKFGRRDHLKKHTRTHYLQAERMMPVFVPLSAMPHVTGFPYLYGY